MASRFKLDEETTAEFRGGEWHAQDVVLLEWLNARAAWLEPGPSDPRPDMTLARDAAEQLGGEVKDLGADPTEADRVY